jgi:hypothetical protein
LETIEQYLRSLLDDEPSAVVVEWPPDAFGCAAALLDSCGGYLAAVTGEWPPGRSEPANLWSKDVKKIGASWRSLAARRQCPPEEIRLAWDTVLSAKNQTVSSVCRDGKWKTIRDALFQIVAAADEACAGAGVQDFEPDAFQVLCIRQLESLATKKKPSTLCRRVRAYKLSVLPKMHTPQSGITIRSLSHHLALCYAREVAPIWIHAVTPHLTAERHGLNVLVVPWPLELHAAAFSVAASPMRNLDSRRFGFFTADCRCDVLRRRAIEKILKKAIINCGRVDVVVFPELAFTSRDLPYLVGSFGKMNPPPIVIGGMALPGKKRGALPRNTCFTLIFTGNHEAYLWTQDKHHRWLLTGDQVKQYGLGGVLDPTRDWWEYMHVAARELAFFSITPWLSFCTLICEDLARPDPVGSLVRAIGPNLVFALLMDGPQLGNRWPARYGTVLAEDPGSSVLTVTSMGMVDLSRPPGKPASRMVALWKDGRSGAPLEIELAHGSDAVLLSLTREFRTEYTADGRNDENSTAYIVLGGVHQIIR